MAEGLNRVMLLGNLGADPDLRFGQGGADTAVLRLRLATTESYFDKRNNERKERTDWHNVVVFGKRGEALQKILQKGSTIFIEGRLQTSSYEKDGQKHYRTDIVATNVILAGRGAGAGAGREEGGGGGGGGGRPFNQNRPAFDRSGAGAGAGGGGGGGRPAPQPQSGGEDDYGGHSDPGADDDIPF
ncbi:MAG: single-stranded DNA-binding protein [Polyangiales bacterium]